MTDAREQLLPVFADTLPPLMSSTPIDTLKSRFPSDRLHAVFVNAGGKWETDEDEDALQGERLVSGHQRDPRGRPMGQAVTGIDTRRAPLPFCASMLPAIVWNSGSVVGAAPPA